MHWPDKDTMVLKVLHKKNWKKNPPLPSSKKKKKKEIPYNFSTPAPYELFVL